MRSGIADLTTDLSVTSRLLYEPETWRSRVVEELLIDSALECSSHRSLQVAPLENMFPITDPDVDDAALVLPVGTVPKGPLFSFSLEADGQTAYLLKRSDIADRQKHFIDAVATAESITFSDRTGELVKAICDFTPGFFLRKRAVKYRWSGWDSAVKSYVQDELGFRFSDTQYDALRSKAQVAGSRLATILDETPDRTSSSENPLLALPLLSTGQFASGPDDIMTVMDEFNSFIDECVATSLRPLQPLAEYGRRYEVLAQCVVPFDRPFLVTMNQLVPLRLSLRGNGRVRVVYNDAESNHISLRINEPDVRLRRKTPLNSRNERATHDVSVVVRDTSEEMALYGSAINRDYSLDLRFRLMASRESAWAVVSLLAVTGAGAFLAITYRPLTSDELAVMIVPTTLISGFLLAQTRTTLAARLQRPLRIATALAVVALWVIVCILYVGGFVEASAT